MPNRRKCPSCGSQTYAHSKWRDRVIVSCSDCPDDEPPQAFQVILEALAAPSLLDDPATARVSPDERRHQQASVIHWALFDAGLLRESAHD